MLTGHDSLSTLQSLKDDITSIPSVGFNLRKWTTNTRCLLSKDDLENNHDIFLDKESTNNKTLGIVWDSNSDILKYSIQHLDNNLTVTKRSILSITSQIFDPLGLLSPVVIKAKILLQILWQSAISWDESLPSDLHTLWLHFINDLHELNLLRIPRHLFYLITILLRYMVLPTRPKELMVLVFMSAQ